jgi:hypothetical protein
MRQRWNAGWVLAAVVVLVAPMVGCSSDSAPPIAGVPNTSVAPVVFTAEAVGETVVDPVYRQGLARADDGWVFSFNDGLFLTDDAFAQTSSVMPAIPAEWKARGFDHLGDIDVVDGVIYAPLEQPDYDVGAQAMLLYDATSLQYQSGVDVAQHHASFVTVDPDTGIAYSMDYFGGDALLRYDVRDGWRPLEPLPMSAFVDRVQGGDVYEGAVWLSTDDDTDGVHRVDLTTGHVDSLGSIGHVDGEGEGIDATPLPAGDLHVLTLDPAITPVRLVDLGVSRR